MWLYIKLEKYYASYTDNESLCDTNDDSVVTLDFIVKIYSYYYIQKFLRL